MWYGGTLAGLSGVRGWHQSCHELVGRHEHLPTLIDMLKDQLQELGSRDVNLHAATDLTEKGLHTLVNKGDDQVSVQHRYSNIEHAIPTEMRLKAHSGAIISSSGAQSASSTVAPCTPSASVNRQRTFDEARWASPMCLEPNETAAFDGAKKRRRKLRSCCCSCGRPNGWT